MRKDAGRTSIRCALCVVLGRKEVRTLEKTQVDVEKRELYVCDPEKNTACKRHTCVYNPDALFHNCSSTTNPAYAKRDENGAPMKAHFSTEGVLMTPERAGDIVDAADT